MCLLCSVLYCMHKWGGMKMEILNDYVNFIDCLFGGSYTAGYHLRGNIRRYDGARGKFSEISLQGAWLSKTKDYMVKR